MSVMHAMSNISMLRLSVKVVFTINALLQSFTEVLSNTRYE